MQSLHIIYRSCAVVKTLSKTSKRPFGLDKPTMILKSLKSLIDSCKAASGANILLEVVDDSSPEEFRRKMMEMLLASNVKHKFNPIAERNNGKSMNACYDIALQSKADLIYFCEDDYAHKREAIPFMLEAYKEKIIGNSNFCIHPTDYPDRYTKPYPSYIFISSHSHWRSIGQTTGTFMIPRKIFAANIRFYREFASINSGKIGGGEDRTINKVYEKTPCLAPIPSLAAHLNDDTLPPLIDWQAELDKIEI